MGIRFRCHHCDFELHVKDFLAGKKSRCPKCEGRFRVPQSDASHSQSVGSTSTQSASVAGTTESSQESTATAVETPPASHGDDSSSLETSTPEEVPSETEATPPIPTEDAPSSVQALEENPDAHWYVRLPSGEQFGPALAEQFREWLGEERVPPEAILWCEGWADWRPAHEVLHDFFHAKYGKTTAPPPPPPPAIPAKEPDLSPAAEPEATSATAEEIALNRTQRERMIKKQRQKRNYFLMVAMLLTLSVAMVVALVFVLIYRT